jgi:hypothetical protein
MTMENNEQTPQPVEKPEAQTPAQEKVSAEKPEAQAPVAENVSAVKPEGQAPVAEQVSAEKPKSEAPVEQEVCSEKAGTVNESPGSKEINKDARMWAMICHLSGLAGIILPTAESVHRRAGQRSRELSNFDVDIPYCIDYSVFYLRRSISGCGDNHCLFCVYADCGGQGQQWLPLSLSFDYPIH